MTIRHRAVEGVLSRVGSNGDPRRKTMGDGNNRHETKEGLPIAIRVAGTSRRRRPNHRTTVPMTRARALIRHSAGIPTTRLVRRPRRHLRQLPLRQDARRSQRLRAYQQNYYQEPAPRNDPPPRAYAEQTYSPPPQPSYEPDLPPLPSAYDNGRDDLFGRESGQVGYEQNHYGTQQAHRSDGYDQHSERDSVIHSNRPRRR